MKMNVPDGMLKAAQNTAEKIAREGGYGIYPVRACVEAALRWLSENPIVPTDEQWRELAERCPTMKYVPLHVCVEWQRRMFLAELEVPEEVRDLLWNGLNSEYGRPDREMQLHDMQIKEAYRRGQKAPK